MEIKEKKKYVRPESELLETEFTILLETISLNVGGGGSGGGTGHELSRQNDFTDFEDSDYDY